MKFFCVLSKKKNLRTLFKIKDVIFHRFHPYWTAFIGKGPGKIPDSIIFIFMLIKHDNYSNQYLCLFYDMIWSADYPFFHLNCQELRRGRPEYYALIHLMCIVWSLRIIIPRLFHSQNGLRSLIMALPEGLCIVFWLTGDFLNDTC